MAEAAHHLAENLMHFGRVLRQAGVAVAPERLQLCLQALQLDGLGSRRDFKATLAACLLDRAEHRPLFEQAFALFWRDPDLLGRAMALLLPRVEASAGLLRPPPQNRRLAEALFPAAPPPPAPPAPPASEAPPPIELDAALSWSQRELLRQRDFESLSVAEWAQARQLLRQLQPDWPRLRTRRFGAAAQGRIAWRASLRAMARGPGLALPHRERPREKLRPLLILADISGSMSRYARVLLHLAHGLSNPQPARARPQIEVFLFGTRLSRISRQLRQRDPDLAIAAAAQQAPDWDGGTRISDCLHQFNRHWARRVLSSETRVLLVTDGLEQSDEPAQLQAQAAALGREAAQLRRQCAELIWLNPLLRYAGFEPRAAGVQALLPEVSLHLPVHNLASLEQVVERLSTLAKR